MRLVVLPSVTWRMVALPGARWCAVPLVVRGGAACRPCLVDVGRGLVVRRHRGARPARRARLRAVLAGSEGRRSRGALVVRGVGGARPRRARRSPSPCAPRGRARRWGAGWGRRPRRCLVARSAQPVTGRRTSSAMPGPWGASWTGGPFALVAAFLTIAKKVRRVVGRTVGSTKARSRCAGTAQTFRPFAGDRACAHWGAPDSRCFRL